MAETRRSYDEEVAPTSGLGVGHGGVVGHDAAPSVLLDEAEERERGLFFGVRGGVAERGLQVGEEQRSAAPDGGDGLDDGGLDGVLRGRRGREVRR